MPERSRAERLALLLSLSVLAVFYGVTAEALGWFPSGVVGRAFVQADRMLSPPHYTSARVYDRDGARTVRPDDATGGPTAVASVWETEEGWIPGVELLDRRGRSLHFWRVDPTRLFADSASRAGWPLDESRVNRFALLPDGHLLVNVNYVGTARLDACGDTIWTLPVGSHHSITMSSDTSFWTPALTRLRSPRSAAYPDGYPGLRLALYHPRLLEVSTEGRVLRSVDVLDVLYDNGLQRHISREHFRPLEEAPELADLLHVNDVDPLPDSLAPEYPMFEPGDLVVSMRNLNVVAVLDPGSGEVTWHASHPFLEQHDPDWTGGGWIGVFDNNHDGTERGTMLGGSRVVALQPHTDSIEVLFGGGRSDPFYTEISGSWQQLPDGNLLLTESTAGRVVEVNPAGEPVWEWVAPPYEDPSVVPEVTQATRYDLTGEEIQRWACP